MKYLFRFLLAAASCLPAQLSFSQSHLAIGFSGGGNLATQHYSLENSLFELDYDNALLWRAGVNAEYRFKRRFSVGVEFAFSQKGNRVKDITFTDENGAEIGSSSLVQTWDYLDNSTYLKYRLLLGKVRPYLMAGNTVGYLMGARSKISNPHIEGFEGPYVQQLSLSGYNRTEFGVFGGAGLEIRHGIRGFGFIESRYALGLSNISKNDALAIYNRSLSLSAGYAFLFGVK